MSKHMNTSWRPDLPIYDSTMITLELADSGNFLYMRTINRDFQSPRFLLSVGRFQQWADDLNGDALYDMDLYNFAAITQSQDHYSIKFFWIDGSCDNLHGCMERVEIPVYIMNHALQGERIKYLYSEKVTTPLLDFSRVPEIVREIAADKQKRRAFCKTLRYAFRNAVHVTFYSDFVPHSFFFQEDRVQGGLILSRENHPRHPGQPCAVRYSIHT